MSETAFCESDGVGFVYLVKMNDLHKIGSSKDPHKRMGQLDVGPYELSLVHTIASVRAGYIERLIHRRFAAERVRGEWFSLCSADVERLKTISRLDSLDDFPEDLLPPPEHRREPNSGRCMVSVDERAYQLMKELARKNYRPLAWEFRRALELGLIRDGIMTREESQYLLDSDAE